MAETHVVSALIEKRARVSGTLVTPQLRILQIKADLAHLDACLRMFKADYEPDDIEPKRTFGKSLAGLPKGAGSRGALDILRDTSEALSCPELARRILERAGKEPEPQAVLMLAKTIHSSFARQKNPTVRFDRTTFPGTWRLI
jgi:hypothetical protein